MSWLADFALSLAVLQVRLLRILGVLEPEKGWDEQGNQTEISYGEDEYEGTFVNAVEHMEAVEV